MTIFKRILNWNNNRGLIKKGFDHKKEVSFIVEELLESTGKYNSFSARKKALELTENIFASKQNGGGNEDEFLNKKEAIVDAFADIIVFSVGSIEKLGYNSEKILDEVVKEIESRKGKIIERKFVRDKNIVPYRANFGKCEHKKV